MKKLLMMIACALTIVLVACTKVDIKATSLLVLEETISVKVGSELDIVVSVLPSDTKDKTLVWTIEDESIATITQSGKLKGIALGDTSLKVASKQVPDVFKIISIEVIDGSWPSESIKEAYQFDLPQFPDYTSIKVENHSNQVITITLAGYKDADWALEQYFTLLKQAGFIASETNDHHIGNFTKPDFKGYIGYHNNASHGKDTIEITVVPQLDVEASQTWEDFNAKVTKSFGFFLPEFPQFEAVWKKNQTPYLSIEAAIKGVENLDEAFHTYEVLLKKDGWVADANNTHHSGFFIKNYVKFSYHASHDDVHTLDIKLVLDATWTDVKNEINDTYDIANFPVFPQFEAVRIMKDENNGKPRLNIGLYGVKDTTEALDSYEARLTSLGFQREFQEGKKFGYFKKEGSPVSMMYIVSATDTISLNFSTTEEKQNPWQKVKDEVKTAFDLMLPNLDFVSEVTFAKDNDLISGKVTLLDKEIAFEKFLKLLVENGWQSKEGNTHHLGTYTKDSYEFYYHESHDIENTTDFTISMV